MEITAGSSTPLSLLEARYSPPSLSLDGTVPAFLLRDEEDLRVREEEEGAAAARQRLPSLLCRCLRASPEGPGQATSCGRQRRPGPGAAGTEEIRHRRAGQGGAVRAGAARRLGSPRCSCSSPGSSPAQERTGSVALRSGAGGAAALGWLCESGLCCHKPLGFGQLLPYRF